MEKDNKTAIISVFDKTNILAIANFLIKNNFEILSSGGTYKYLTENISSENITKIEDYTNFPEILDGRVKTLHPKIYGGILSRSNNADDDKQLNDHSILKFNLVIVNLYPFEKKLFNEFNELDEAIENIDIGGVSLIRAAAKNYKDTIVLTNPNDYNNFIENYGKLYSNDYKKSYAIKAFNYITQYDMSISNYFDGDNNV